MGIPASLSFISKESKEFLPKGAPAGISYIDETFGPRIGSFWLCIETQGISKSYVK